MTKNRHIAAAIAGLAIALGGCSAADVSGTAPTNQDVMAIWQVSSGSPDYIYKFGEGTADGESFELVLDSDPPAEALNAYGLGIAYVVALPEGMSMPADGKLSREDSDALFENPFISDRHSIIFKERQAEEGRDWSEPFENGYSCGVCVEAPEGQTFDSYAPTECDAFELRREEEGDVCNWT